MTENNFLLKSAKASSGLRLSVLFGSFFIFLLLSSFFSGLIDSLQIGDKRTDILLSSVFQCLFAFCIPAYILAKFCTKDWKQWLYLTKTPQLKAIVGVIIVFVISTPAMEWLINWNSNIHFPESLTSLENLLRSWEAESEKTTRILLDTHGWFPVLMGVIIIGVLTGFSEELFFRGGLQGILVRSSIGKHVSVWLAAIIFSAMHFQFFGFLPRLLMGAFFGYLLVWTESIWVPAFAHVLNNSIVVISAAVTGEYSADVLDSQTNSMYFDNSLIVIGSVVATVLFLLIFRDSIFKNKWLRNQPTPAIEK